MENLEEKIFKEPSGEALEKETTRREFLVKTGKFLSGLAALSYMGSELFSMGEELIESRKPERETEKEANEEKVKGHELFTQERLMEEIGKIKITNPDNWPEIAKERLNNGIDKFVKTAAGPKKSELFAHQDIMMKGSIIGMGAGGIIETLSNKKEEGDAWNNLLELITNSPSREIINWYGIGGAFLAEGGYLAEKIIKNQPADPYSAHWSAASEIAKKTAFELIFNERPFAAKSEEKNKTNTTNIVSEMCKEEIIKNLNGFLLPEMIEGLEMNSYLEQWGASVVYTASQVIRLAIHLPKASANKI